VAKSQGGAAKQPAKAPGAAAKQPAAKPNQTPANNPPAAAAAEQLAAKPDQPTAKTPPASTVAMTEPASSIQQAEFESPAVSNAKQPVGQVSPNQVQTDRPQGFRNETTLPQNLTSNNPSVDGSAEQPLVPGEAGPAANRSATSQPDYPATNPASYQYPADYHERLLSPPGTYGSPQNSPWSGGAGDSQRPSTARLQPRIEPPPIR
jgi:hypothetical protein